MYNLAGKTAVITGAAGGLGKALAYEFFKQGCNLALVDINTPILNTFVTSFLFPTLIHKNIGKRKNSFDFI